MGDFNTIKNLSKTEDGDNTWDSGMDDFKSCVESLGLEDLRATGAFNHPIHRKLDRALVNSDWMINLSLAQAHVGNNGLSNYCPILIDTGFSLPKARKPFQFFNHMMELEGYSELISSKWNNQLTGNHFSFYLRSLRE